MGDTKRLAKIANDTERFARKMAKDHAEADTLRARVAELEANAKTLATANADNARELQERISELESALAKSAARETALMEKLKVATDLLNEGNKGFGRILIATSDDKAVRDWQKRCGAALAKIKEA